MTTYGVVRSECELLPKTHSDEKDDADEKVEEAWYNQVRAEFCVIASRKELVGTEKRQE